MQHLDRRAFVRVAGAGIIAGPASAESSLRPRRQRRLLVFTKSSGFVHSIVAPGPDGTSLVDRTVTALGRENGFEVTATKDGTVFSSPDLTGFDAFLFATTGNLTEPGTDGTPPMTAAGKQALLDAIAGGKGFVGVHNATDTFPSPADAIDPYIAMIGGEFLTHGQPQTGTVRVLDPDFPGMPQAQEIRRPGEWYTFRNLADDLHPLLDLETADLEGEAYRRPPYPVAWTRRHGNGRVAYHAFGHFEEEWSDDMFPGMLLGMIRWAFGDA